MEKFMDKIEAGIVHWRVIIYYLEGSQGYEKHLYLQIYIPSLLQSLSEKMPFNQLVNE